MNLRKLQWLLAAFLKRHRYKGLGALAVILLALYLLRTASVEPIWGWVQNSVLTSRFSEGLVGTPQNLNPLFAESDSERDLSSVLFRGLTKTSVGGDTTADLAESWEVSSSGQVYLFHLKGGLTFSNSDPLTVEDVIFTYELAKNPDSGSLFMDTFRNIEIQRVGDSSVLFRLRDPFSPFLSLTSLGILPKKILEKVPVRDLRFHKFNVNPIGSSPYRVKSIDKEGAVLDGEGKELAFRFYNDANDLKVALKMGEVKAAGFTDPIDFQGWPNLKVSRSPLYQRFVGIFYNLRGGVTAEKSLRQGLSHAINRGAIIADILGGGADEIDSPIPITSWAKAEGLRQYEFDPAKAQSIIEKAGWIGGPVRAKAGKRLEIILSFREGTQAELVAAKVAEDWAKIGVRAILNPLSPNEFRSRVVENKDFQAAIFTQEVGVDPDQYVLWHTTQADNTNISGLKLPKLDKALEDARREVDRNRRRDLYADFQRFFLDEVPVTLLYQPKYSYVVSTKVAGVELKEVGLPSDRFKDLGLWKIEGRIF